jgi:hypothetical protein
MTVTGSYGIAEEEALIGTYSRMQNIFDFRPVYTMTAANAKGTNHTIYLFYDSSSLTWKFGPKIDEGGGVYAYSRSTSSRPHLVQGDWKLFSKVKGEFELKPNVHVTCKSGHSSFVPLPASLIADADSKCVGFKATKECNPSGEADTANDKSCDTEIEDSQGGYCLCYNNRRKNFACGHNTFTCADICKVHFPEVIAQSHERLWTNQVAGNLVQTAGDWMSSITTDQWIVFDLGAKYHVKSVELKMWGSTANPKDCVLQSSDNQLGPWNDAKKFTVTAAETEDQTVALTPVEGRYFRTFFKNNYGAEWGMGLNQVSFEYTEPSPTPVPAPDRCNQYTDCSGCVYTSMLSDQENCGWCGATSTCTTGFAGKPSTGSCSADWMWTSCSTGKLWFLHKMFRC